HGEHEQQSIAFSDDRVNFTPYEGNPVIANDSQPDFRDPKVFRNEILNCWTVVIAAGDHVEFHASNDLIHWEKTGEFGAKENRQCQDTCRWPYTSISRGNPTPALWNTSHCLKQSLQQKQHPNSLRATENPYCQP
ncbi:MAG: hypothetical protein II240_06230, partial [Bacteroidaceae bacterium]|nr:hypothetical protein [Bacteroidaceae bacterium]